MFHSVWFIIPKKKLLLWMLWTKRIFSPSGLHNKGFFLLNLYCMLYIELKCSCFSDTINVKTMYTHHSFLLFFLSSTHSNWQKCEKEQLIKWNWWQQKWPKKTDYYCFLLKLCMCTLSDKSYKITDFIWCFCCQVFFQQ